MKPKKRPHELLWMFWFDVESISDIYVFFFIISVLAIHRILKGRPPIYSHGIMGSDLDYIQKQRYNFYWTCLKNIIVLDNDVGKLCS